MDKNAPIQLYFLTGFLGSGKTTLLNNLLDYLAQRKKKAGVLVNEWGQAGIDGSLINKKYMEIKELNNGQIFCSCLAGNFVQALVTLGDLPLEYVLVETSGLANPITLHTVLQDLKKLTGNRYQYQGMICLVDPVNFLDLGETVMAVEEQVIKSQYIMVNKIDLVDGAALAQVEKRIRELNPDVPVVKTSYGKIDDQIFDLHFNSTKQSPEVVRHLKRPINRPRHYLILIKETVDPERIKSFAEVVIKDAFRIKGFVCAKDGCMYLDGVNQSVSLTPAIIRGTETKIVIISRIGEELGPVIKAKWQEIVSIPAEIKEDVFNPLGGNG